MEVILSICWTILLYMCNRLIYCIQSITDFLDYFGLLLLSVMVKGVLKYSIAIGPFFSFIVFFSSFALYVLKIHIRWKKFTTVLYSWSIETFITMCSKGERSPYPFCFSLPLFPLITSSLVHIPGCENDNKLTGSSTPFVGVATTVFTILLSLNIA